MPDRGRRFLQAGLILAAMVTAVAIPLIARRGTPASGQGPTAPELRANLCLLLGIIAGVTLDRVRGPGGAGSDRFAEHG